MDKKIMKILCCIFTPIILLMLVAYYRAENVPTTIFIREGEAVKSDKLVRINQKNQTASVDVLGLLPIKSVDVKSVKNDVMLYPGGQPIGVKLSTKGVLVIALSDIKNDNGKVTSPAAVSGIQIGDNIIK